MVEGIPQERDERDTEPPSEPDTNPGAPASLAHVEIWQDKHGARGYTIVTPDGGLGSGPIHDLVAALHLRELLPAVAMQLPPEATPDAVIVFEPPKPPAPGSPGSIQQGYWPGSLR